MADTNWGRLGDGLKLYTDAMRRLARERLQATLKDRWWDAGVVAHLTDQQRQSLRRDMEKDPKKDRLDHVEAPHLVRIITKNFDHSFQGVFNDFRKTQSWLNQAALARNDWAHPRTGDMQADDVAHALYAMVQVLAEARLPEAARVERLRREIVGMAPEPAKAGEYTPAAAPAASAAAPAFPSSGQLPYWWQVCEPQDAFKDPAAIDESVFAASLGGVFAGSAREEYLNPEVFLSHTHFTEALTQTVRDVASRMGGGAGPAITEMQTPFGGGKTHALLTLYHLIKDPEKAFKVPGVAQALGDVKFPKGSKVIVFDGQEYGADPWEKEGGYAISTLWGELAFQADRRLYQNLISSSDGKGEAPGNAAFRQVLQAASPCLILMDELVSYLVKLRYAAPNTRAQRLYRQTVQFLHDMLQEAGNVKGVCVLISLPKSQREFGGLDPQELQRQLAIVADLQSRTDRVVSKRTPVNDEEIYTLTSKRLFKRVDAKAAANIAHAYRECYERTRALYDPGVFSEDYLKHQIAAYPLHPELIDAVYKKWSTASDFPRTRAVLKLLALVVGDQWVKRRDAFSIQSAHVDLERERIRTSIVSAAGSGGGYDAVVRADIIGGDAHADVEDQRRGNAYHRHHIGRGLATTVLMHSFGGAEQAGALPWELRLGTVAPNVGPEYVTEVLGSLEQSLWYVHREGERLKFQTRPNIYRMIARRAEEESAAVVADRLRDTLKTAIGSAPGFRVVQWSVADGVIPDRPEPTIAVLDRGFAVTPAEDGLSVTDASAVEQLWDKSGGGLRQWRNALILVAPDQELGSRAEEAMRDVTGYESVIAMADKGQLEVAPAELRGLKSQQNAKKESLRTSLVTAYRWVFFPEDARLGSLGLAVPATKDDTIVGRAILRLSDQDYGQPKVLTRMSAVYFNSKLAPRLWKDEGSPLELGETSRRFFQWTYLPLLPDRESTLRACIQEGVSQKLWAVAIGDSSTLKYTKLIQSQDEMDAAVNLFDGSASLVKGERLQLVRETLTPEADAKGEVEAAPPPGQTSRPKDDKKISEKDALPPPPKRFARIRLHIGGLRIGKTGNLQPYLFKVLQEKDAGTELAITMDVHSPAGIPADALEQRIVQGMEQLGITVSWEEMG